MHFLKTLFWVITVIIILAFSHANWSEVTVNLWAGLVLKTKLPVLMLGSLLLGFLPPYILLRLTRWRMRRRIDLIERGATIITDPVPSDAITPPPTPLEP